MFVSVLNLAKSPSIEDTVWKYAGEDVTSACPGYSPGSIRSNFVQFYWFEQEYDCKGMNHSTVKAYYDSHRGKIAAFHLINKVVREKIVSGLKHTMTLIEVRLQSFFFINIH